MHMGIRSDLQEQHKALSLGIRSFIAKNRISETFTIPKTLGILFTSPIWCVTIGQLYSTINGNFNGYRNVPGHSAIKTLGYFT